MATPADRIGARRLVVGAHYGWRDWLVQRVTAVMMEGKGDLLPVSAFPIDGTWPVGTTKWEKRNISLTVPVWDSHQSTSANLGLGFHPAGDRSPRRNPVRRRLIPVSAGSCRSKWGW